MRRAIPTLTIPSAAEPYRPPVSNPLETLAADIQGAAKNLQAVLSEFETKGKEHAAHAISSEMFPVAQLILARQQKRLIIALVAGSILTSAIVAALISWQFQPAQTMCVAKDGGQFCGAWTIPPRRSQ